MWLLFLAQYDFAFILGLAFFAYLAAVYSTPEDKYKEISTAAFNRAKSNHDTATAYFLAGLLVLLPATFAQFGTNEIAPSSPVFMVLIWIEVVMGLTGAATSVLALCYLQLMKRKGFDKVSMPRLLFWLVGWLVSTGIIAALVLIYQVKLA
jgi:hypothetical protein